MPVVAPASPVTSTPTGILIDDLVNRTKRRLLGSTREEMNKLSGAISAGATTIATTYPVGTLGQNGRVAIDDEIMRVWAVSGQTLTVERGQDGSTAAAHADASMLYANPRFSRFDIIEELKQEIRSWEPRLYSVGTITLTSGSTTSTNPMDGGARAYNMAGVTGEVYGILDVSRQPEGTSTVWPRVRKWRFRGKQNLTSFPSGYAIDIQEPVSSGGLIQVTYAGTFDLSAFAGSEDIATIGLRATMADIPVIGVEWRMMNSRENARTFGEAQGEPRNSVEVTSGSITALSRNLERLRDKRISEERDALHRLFPMVGFS